MLTPSTSVALTSLLNSLHTHLQSQTQLLPTLHAQLGLPPSALEDELKSLQKQLIEGVERQIDLRRKEVGQWMERCEEVERECIRYSTALGGNIKSTGSSVGELRKESILPKRFELVSEYQEKLRQLYHTKLEQLTTLSNRLQSLARTLGHDFFAQDIIEPTGTLGSLSDPQARSNVTPERFLKLEKELVRGKTEVAKRLHHLSTILVQIDWLHTELGIAPPDVDDSSSSTLALNASTSTTQINPSNAAADSDPFLEVSTPTPVSQRKPITPLLFEKDLSSSLESDCHRIFARFVARLEEADDEALPENHSIPMGLEGVDPSPGLLGWAEGLHASLKDIKRRREAHIQAMYDQLEGLWRRLGVEDADMDAFVEAHRGSTEDTVREYEEELERMLELKRERMGTFVESARTEIVKLWDALMIGEDERADFAPFVDDEFTEELLSIHEDEVRRLKEERRLKAPLLAGIKKYYEICEEEKELAAAASDQTRLLGRGSRDPGRLLREEKMRKRVSKEKPRLEQDLLMSIPVWEQEMGRPFLVHGVSLFQLLMETVSAADQENRRKPPRAGSVPARSTTPTNSIHSYVPGVKTGAVTPAVRTASGVHPQSMPNKRQRVEETFSQYGNGRIIGQESHQPGPLGIHRANNANNPPQSEGVLKARNKTPVGNSSLPRPVPHISMPLPKPGTQHHLLGHGRIPSSVLLTVPVVYPFGVNSRSNSANYGKYSSGVAGHGRLGSATAADATKKARYARNESFKPRPSMDMGNMDSCPAGVLGNSRWGIVASTLQEEEDEDF